MISRTFGPAPTARKLQDLLAARVIDISASPSRGGRRGGVGSQRRLARGGLDAAAGDPGRPGGRPGARGGRVPVRLRGRRRGRRRHDRPGRGPGRCARAASCAWGHRRRSRRHGRCAQADLPTRTSCCVWQLYEPLAVRPAGLRRPGDDPGRVDRGRRRRRRPVDDPAREGVEFHNGKTLTADDLIFSIKRILDQGARGRPGCARDRRRKGMKSSTSGRCACRSSRRLAIFPTSFGQYFNGIVPVGYDPKKPVGTGPVQVRAASRPASERRSSRNENYWRDRASRTSTSSRSSTSPTTARA